MVLFVVTEVELVLGAPTSTPIKLFLSDIVRMGVYSILVKVVLFLVPPTYTPRKLLFSETDSERSHRIFI